MDGHRKSTPSPGCNNHLGTRARHTEAVSTGHMCGQGEGSSVESAPVARAARVLALLVPARGPRGHADTAAAPAREQDPLDLLHPREPGGLPMVGQERKLSPPRLPSSFFLIFLFSFSFFFCFSSSFVFFLLLSSSSSSSLSLSPPLSVRSQAVSLSGSQSQLNLQRVC